MIDDDTVVAGQSADEQPSAVEENLKSQEQPRAKDGKFAGKQASEQASEQQDAPKEEGKQVPIQALDSQRERRRKAEQERDYWRGVAEARNQLAAEKPQQQEPPKPLPDWYTDPEAAFNARLKPILDQFQDGSKSAQQTLIEQKAEVSRLVAEQAFGEELVRTAWEESQRVIREDPRAAAILDARLKANPRHPYGELIKWHKEQSALSRFGDDPEAAFEAEVERRLAERMNGQQPTGQAQQRAPVLPPTLPSNFATARNQGGGRAPAYGGPKPLNEIFGGR